MNSLLLKVMPTLVVAAFTLSGCGGGGDHADSSSQSPANNLPPTVSAGNNQTATASTRVNLNGTATDSDGTIANYSWVQTSGDTVSLNNDNTANAYFYVPDSPSTEVFTFVFTASDNLDKTASDNVTISLISAPGETVELSGKVTFDLVPFNTDTNGLDYSATKASPARGILVEAIDTSGTRVGATTTDNNGLFSLDADANTTLRIRISAQMVQTEGAQWDVKVTDNTNNDALYVTEGDLFNTATAGGARNFHMASGWDGNSYSKRRAAAPFAILDAIYGSMQKVASVDSDTVFPPLEVHWSENNSVASGNIEDGDIGSSFYQEEKIYVVGKADSDTDEYDRHIIIHEWGHYFEDKLSRSESLGGEHSGEDRLDMRVAFSEGWGNALSAIVTDDPFYRDSFGSRQKLGWSIDMESNHTINRGWFNETSVQSILYDLYDNESDGQDNIALGFAPIYASLISASYLNNPYFASIYTFVDQLKTQQSTSIITVINNLLNEQQIYGSGSDGTGETNNGGISSVLPVYKTATVGGNTRVCYNNNAGVKNKLGNSILVAFDAATTGSYTFSVTNADAYGTLSDPNLRLFKSRILVAENNSSSLDGTANLTANLGSTGLHILEVYIWEEFSLLGMINNGTACFNLQITN